MRNCQEVFKISAYLVASWAVMCAGYADQNWQVNNQSTNGLALLTVQTNSFVLSGALTDSSFAATKTTMDEVRDVIEDYQKSRKTRAAPKDYQTLVTLGLRKVRTWKDAWGNVLQYECNGDMWTLRSAGADKKHGTEDDLILRCEDGMNVTSVGFPTGHGRYLDSQVVSQNDMLRKNAEEDVGVKKDGWTQVEIPGLVSIDIPPTIELQKGVYKTFKETVAKITLDLDLRSQALTFQQSGLNEFEDGSTRRYARIILKNFYNEDVDYRLTEKEITPEVLSNIENDEYKNIKKGFEQANRVGVPAKLIKWYPIMVVSLSGMTGYRVAYLRQQREYPPVYVEEYKIGNGHYLHSIVFSYRQSEEAFWKDDYEGIKNRIRFVRK